MEFALDSFLLRDWNTIRTIVATHDAVACDNAQAGLTITTRRQKSP
jgi:hypothetical protein